MIIEGTMRQKNEKGQIEGASFEANPENETMPIDKHQPNPEKISGRWSFSLKSNLDPFHNPTQSPQQTYNGENEEAIVAKNHLSRNPQSSYNPLSYLWGQPHAQTTLVPTTTVNTKDVLSNKKKQTTKIQKELIGPRTIGNSFFAENKTKKAIIHNIAFQSIVEDDPSVSMHTNEIGANALALSERKTKMQNDALENNEMIIGMSTTTSTDTKTRLVQAGIKDASFDRKSRTVIDRETMKQNAAGKSKSAKIGSKTLILTEQPSNDAKSSTHFQREEQKLLTETESTKQVAMNDTKINKTSMIVDREEGQQESIDMNTSLDSETDAPTLLAETEHAKQVCQSKNNVADKIICSTNKPQKLTFNQHLSASKIKMLIAPESAMIKKTLKTKRLTTEDNAIIDNSTENDVQSFKLQMDVVSKANAAHALDTAKAGLASQELCSKSSATTFSTMGSGKNLNIELQSLNKKESLHLNASKSKKLLQTLTVSKNTTGNTNNLSLSQVNGAQTKLKDSQAQEKTYDVSPHAMEDTSAKAALSCSRPEPTSEVNASKITDEPDWSIEEHTQMLKLLSIHGPDFKKIAESMTIRNFSEVRFYAFRAFTGDALAHWSIKEYENFLQMVPKHWIKLDGWKKKQVIDKIRERDVLRANLHLSVANEISKGRNEVIETDECDSKSLQNSQKLSSADAFEPRKDAETFQCIQNNSIKINKNDVLFFIQGQKFKKILFSDKQNRPGNVYFQQLLTSKRSEYSKCTNNVDEKKREIVQNIINAITDLDPPGRFFRVDGATGILKLLSGDEVFVAVRKRIYSAPVAENKSRNGDVRFPANKDKYLRQLASFNAAPQKAEDAAISDGAKRPRRQRVSFLEPSVRTQGNESNEPGIEPVSLIGKKRRRAVTTEYASSTRTRTVRSRTASNSTKATRSSSWRHSPKAPKTKRSLTKEVTEKPKKAVRRRLSRNAMRRVTTNALAGFLHRERARSSNLNRNK